MKAAELGYRMPAEWESHDAVWLSWPYDPATFPDRMEKVEEAYVEIIRVIHRGEHVKLLVRNEEMKKGIRERLQIANVNPCAISFYIYDYADVWIRDYGPIFLVNDRCKGLAIVDWEFNAWGEKYKTLIRDTNIPAFIEEIMNVPYFKPGIVLEGGSIDVNGKGALMTTEQCLLNKNRNPLLERNEIEGCLRDYLGARKIIWLKSGIAGDDTDGHVDDIARFVNPRTVLCIYEEDKNDENYDVLRENYEIIVNARDQDGDKLDVVKLPTPGFTGTTRERLPASYANFYIGNNTVLVPVFGTENDDRALDIISGFFADRQVVGIDCRDIIHGYGSIHCITQQEPSAI